MEDLKLLSNLIFKNIFVGPEEYEAKYPPRALPPGACVTRFAPSPTGFMHMGNMFPAFVNKLISGATQGVFFLRIEDTDKKREVEDGVTAILKGLAAFGLEPDEGVVAEDEEKGAYGPYKQSQRREIYQAFAKKLYEEGKAYPCFCTEEELNDLRQEQEEENVNKGYYGPWARCSRLSFEEQKAALDAGKPFVIRLRSAGDPEKRIVFKDLIKGEIKMPQNTMDVVLLKTDGIPTYHFAHAVDDHLMGTTHVIRGDEWISSVALHVELFAACGFKLPKYAHIAPLMKEEDGSRRKLSKRLDPEAAVMYFVEKGYPKESVLEYLLTLINSNFEQWRSANRTAALTDFPFKIKKMSAGGALFDLVKLNDVSKNVISFMSADEVYDKALAWAREYDPLYHELLLADPDYSKKIFAIDRGGKKPRKDIALWSELKDYTVYFFDEVYEPQYDLPDNISPKDAAAILESYLEVFNAQDDRETWFSKIKDICLPLGFTPNVKEYRKNPEAYKGHVGHVSSVIRLALTSRQNTPDLHSIIALLGNDRARQRLGDALKYHSK